MISLLLFTLWCRIYILFFFFFFFFQAEDGIRDWSVTGVQTCALPIAKEGNAIAELGKYDFLYTNHFFTPERDRLGYKVIARPAGPGIRSQIVVPIDSPIQSLADLNGKEVAFVTPDGFTGYWLPMDALLRAKVNIKVAFTGNQEASYAQL